ncbi:MAG: TetR/AcrR family transcriptional regulator [Aquisalinus sp.]|nr:TetR/AcrR family transcriptional regulator [Aquisalinus sp.]
MVSQKQRSENTKTRLLETFRSSTLEFGYAATTIQLILEKTGLSKGALYHHFKSKSDLMTSLYFQESRSAFERAQSRINSNEPEKSRLKTLYLSWMQEVLSPDVSSILFEIGPSALGPKRAKDIENEVTLKHIQSILEDATEKGEIKPIDTKMVAAMLNALVGEAALYRLRTETDTSHTLAKLLDAVLAKL